MKATRRNLEGSWPQHVRTIVQATSLLLGGCAGAPGPLFSAFLTLLTTLQDVPREISGCLVPDGDGMGVAWGWRRTLTGWTLPRTRPEVEDAEFIGVTARDRMSFLALASKHVDLWSNDRPASL